jgi:hypothetical protein
MTKEDFQLHINYRSFLEHIFSLRNLFPVIQDKNLSQGKSAIKALGKSTFLA